MLAFCSDKLFLQNYCRLIATIATLLIINNLRAHAFV